MGSSVGSPYSTRYSLYSSSYRSYSSISNDSGSSTEDCYELRSADYYYLSGDRSTFVFRTRGLRTRFGAI